MNFTAIAKRATLVFACFIFSNLLFSQQAPYIKFLAKETIDEVRIDFDFDGDLDLIIAGVFLDKNQGRVYIVEAKGQRYGKPEYIYSYPTIGTKQKLEVDRKDNLITINTTGMSPMGEQKKYMGMLRNGVFDGLLVPPVTASKQ